MDMNRQTHAGGHEHDKADATLANEHQTGRRCPLPNIANGGEVGVATSWDQQPGDEEHGGSDRQSPATGWTKNGRKATKSQLGAAMSPTVTGRGEWWEETIWIVKSAEGGSPVSENPSKVVAVAETDNEKRTLCQRQTRRLWRQW